MGRTTFTNITPLPSAITREIVIDFLHDHLEMIDLNPLIIERHTIPPPDHALPEEHRCIWYSLTDRISYLPGVSGKVSYTCAFHNLPEGLQTHCYAAMGLEIRDRWSVGGSLPGEPPQPVELGLNAPMSGLYLREDVDLRCNSIMLSFVKKTLKKSHGSLVDRLSQKAQIKSANQSRMSVPSSNNSSVFLSSPTPPSLGSDSLAVSPIGPLLPPSPAPNRSHLRSHSMPPTNHQHLQQPEQTYQQFQPPQQPQQEEDASHSEPEQHDYKERHSYHHPPEPSYQPYGHAYQPPLAPPNGGMSESTHPAAPYSGAATAAVPTQPPLELPTSRPEQGGGLNYSGSVYRGNSKPQDYAEFSMNPFEEADPTLGQQRASEATDMFPAPLQVPQDRRVKPAELQ